MNKENSFEPNNMYSQTNNETFNNPQLQNFQNVNNTFDSNNNINQNINSNERLDQSMNAFQSDVQQPSSINIESNNIVNQYQNNDNNFVSKNNKIKLLFESKPHLKKVLMIILPIVLLLIVIIVVMSLPSGNSSFKKNEVYPLDTTSYFEKVNDLYVLKDKNGKVLLDNISDYDYFCNGTTKVKNLDNEVAIVDDKGKFVAEYGKYRFISHVGCFYEVTDDSDVYQKMLLKSDGSILYKNEDDLLLKDIVIKERGYFLFGSLLDSMGYTMIEFEKDKQYILYSANGKELLKFDIIEDEYPEFSDQNIYVYNDGKYNETDNTKYLALYYNNRTYIFNLVDEKLTFTLDDKYDFKEINRGNDNQYILKCETGTCESPMIVVNNDKISYETDCESLRFADDQGKLRCHDSVALMDSYYNINGKFIETVKSEQNKVVYSTTVDGSQSTTYELTTSGKIVIIVFLIGIVGVVLFVIKKKRNKVCQINFNFLKNNNSKVDIISDVQVSNTNVEYQSVDISNISQVNSLGNAFSDKGMKENKKISFKWIMLVALLLIIIVVVSMFVMLKKDNKNVEVLSFQCNGEDLIRTYHFEGNQISRVIYTLGFKQENEAIHYYDITLNDPFERFMNVKINGKVVTYEFKPNIISGVVDSKDKEYFMKNESECLLKDFVPELE